MNFSRPVKRLRADAVYSLRSIGGTLAGRSILRAATATSLGRAKGREGPFFLLAKRLRYGQTARFTYQREGCSAIDLRLAGAALHLYYLRDYEPETLGPIVALAKEAHTFLDVGSQAGVYSLVVASANPSIEVFAFEAAPMSVSIMLDNIRLNAGRRGIGAVRVCAAAIDDSVGLDTFHLAGGNSSLNPAFRSNTQELLCPKLSIDSFLEAVDHQAPIDLVKIDTESTEPAVLRGMARTIEQWRPVIAIEVLRGRTEEALDLFLSEADYRALWLRRDGPHVRDSIVGDENHLELNYLLVPTEKWDDTFARVTGAEGSQELFADLEPGAGS